MPAEIEDMKEKEAPPSTWCGHQLAGTGRCWECEDWKMYAAPWAPLTHKLWPEVAAEYWEDPHWDCSQCNGWDEDYLDD